MTAPQPIADDELATIKARAERARIFLWTPHDRRIATEDVPRLVAEVERLRALVPQPAPPGTVIVSWSGKRHLHEPGSRVLNDGSMRARCSTYTYGTEPDADGDVVRGVKQGTRADLLPMCKSCTRSATR